MVVILKRSKYPYFFIEGNISSDIIDVLKNELSYYVEGYEYSDRYKTGQWDGKECLLKVSRTGHYYFPAGLVNRVTKVLDSLGVDYDVVEPEFDVKHLNLQWKGPELRPYQEEAVLKAIEKGSGVICLPTGAGKTIVGLKLIHSLDCPTLICVHTKELLYQWYDRVRSILGYTPGLVGDGHKQFKAITIAMIQTAVKLDIPRGFNMILIDECHHVPANTFFRVAMRCDAFYRYGLSATPKREDGADLKIFAGVGEICANITAEKLIDQGYLAKPKFVFYDVPAIRLPRGNWQRAYREGIVVNEVRNTIIAGVVNNLVMDDDLQVYVHVERINHGQILSSMIDCPFISGKDSTDKRQRVLKAFKQGRLRAMVSTLLGEGVDIPEMDAIVLAHGLKTSIGTIQKIGRALRVRKDKDEAIIVDFIDKGPYIAKHFEQRYKTMKEYYGKYFKPEIRR